MPLIENSISKDLKYFGCFSVNCPEKPACLTLEMPISIPAKPKAKAAMEI